MAAPLWVPFPKGEEAVVEARLRDQGNVELVGVEDQGSPGRIGVPVGFVEQLEESSPNVHGDSHDNALRDSWDKTERSQVRGPVPLAP